ncbi:MAG: hypothetical protein PHF17_08530 [Arcobacteraceae bacterium]|nr:hypothetical protein [Arcobacteraceae bacterium]
MSDINSFEEEGPEHFGIMLPCKPSDFGEFISGLLGKPQTIEKAFRGTFEIKKEDIFNTYYLIEQRIQQQNEAQLIQFSVKIFYSDESSILLNSIKAFEHYAEVRPLESIKVALSWTYLIKFKNKSVPEKQEINLSFDSDAELILDAEELRYRFYGRGTSIFCRINHTERTWGVDIESLLTGHVHSLTKMPTKFEQFLYTNSTIIGFMSGLLFLASLLFASWNAYSIYRDKYLENINTMANQITEPMEFITFKLTNLLNFVISGTDSQLSQIFMIAILISIFLSVFFGSLISDKVNNRPKSFVLLSALAEKRQKESAVIRKNNWIYFIVTIVIGVGTSIIGSILFKRFVENLI